MLSQLPWRLRAHVKLILPCCVFQPWFATRRTTASSIFRSGVHQLCVRSPHLERRLTYAGDVLAGQTHQPCWSFIVSGRQTFKVVINGELFATRTSVENWQHLLTRARGRGSWLCCPNTSGSLRRWRGNRSPSYPSGCQSSRLHKKHRTIGLKDFFKTNKITNS